MSNTNKPLPNSVNFATAGLGGLLGWGVIHPFNTLGIRMNLASSSGCASASNTSFISFASNIIKKEGYLSLYNGLEAGLMRQFFYATSRFGFFEVFRDEIAKYREVDFLTRFVAGVTSGGNIYWKSILFIFILIFIYF